MRSLILIALIGAVVWALLRNLREQRSAWLRRLSLVGTWVAHSDAGNHELVLAGAAGEGTYVETDRRGDVLRRERGRWKVAGQTLHFTPETGSVSACELRLFEAGRIGVHGPGRERRVYERRRDNVVALRRRG